MAPRGLGIKVEAFYLLEIDRVVGVSILDTPFPSRAIRPIPIHTHRADFSHLLSPPAPDMRSTSMDRTFAVRVTWSAPHHLR